MLKIDSEFQIFAEAGNLNIDTDRIFDLLGYTTKETDEFIIETVSKCISWCQDLYKPAANVIIKEITTVEDDSVFIGESCLSTKKIIANQLKGAKYLALFVSTIGKDAEMLSQDLFKRGEGLEAYIISLVASEAADSNAAFIHKKIEEIANSENFGITNRFSPGYCKWDVADQKMVFSFFQNNTCEITLNDSALMSPIKSVSGIIGIGKNLKLKNYPCKACDEDRCLYRDK